MKIQFKQIYYWPGIIFYLSLIIGFALNENLTGGAQADYLMHKEIAIRFSQNFTETLLNFNKENTRHSPFLLIVLSFFEKIELSDLIIRLINLHFLLLIVVFFYKCLKIKFSKYNNKSLYLISLLLFLSPTFRSLSIWPDSRLYGILFFIISIYYFLNFCKENDKKLKLKFALLNTFYLCLASYFSPNFCLFVFFFLFFFFNHYKFNKSFIIIILLNFFLAIPAIYYVFFLKIYFFLASVSSSGATLTALNPANKLILISSIFLFHYLPLFFFVNSKYKIKIRQLINLGFLFLIAVFFFNYSINFTGGGIIYKLSNIIFKNNYALYLFAFLGVLLLFNLAYKNLSNFLLILIIMLGNPQLEIYHKYYDPMLLILFFTLFNINFDRSFNNNKIYILYIFNLIFLTASLLK
jgi:hypothetical protein